MIAIASSTAVGFETGDLEAASFSPGSLLTLPADLWSADHCAAAAQQLVSLGKRLLDNDLREGARN